jgi:hypothetical protein
MRIINRLRRLTVGGSATAECALSLTRIRRGIDGSCHASTPVSDVAPAGSSRCGRDGNVMMIGIARLAGDELGGSPRGFGALPSRRFR